MFSAMSARRCLLADKSFRFRNNCGTMLLPWKYTKGDGRRDEEHLSALP